MIRSIAHVLGDWAVVVLPRSRRDWGLAMRAELNHIDADGHALGFALGCAAAGLRDGVWHLILTNPSRLAISLLTLGFAVFHLGCGWRGLTILSGAPEPFYLRLASGDRAEQLIAIAYRESTPMIVLCLLVLGGAHLAAAASILVGGQRAFAWAWGAALVSATALSVVIYTITGLSASLTVLFAAAAIQAVTVPFLSRHQVQPTPPEPVRFGTHDPRV